MKQCCTNIGKAALLFGNELQKHETFSLTTFQLMFRDIENKPLPDNIQAFDMSTGKVQKLDEVPPELLKEIVKRLNKIVLEENGEEKGAEAEATV